MSDIFIGAARIPKADMDKLSLDGLGGFVYSSVLMDPVYDCCYLKVRFRIPDGHPGITIARPHGGDEEDTLP